MQRTKIEWTDYTSNPLVAYGPDGRRGWACEKISPGCAHCYAERINRRLGTGLPYTRDAARGQVTLKLNARELDRLLTADALAGRRVFVGDMTDLFLDTVSDDELDTLFAVFALRQDVTWQVLTKRPERARRYVTWQEGPITRRKRVARAAAQMTEDGWCDERGIAWPLPNVWLIASCENQAALEARAPELLATPAAVRGLSLEPLLGPVHLIPRCPPEWQPVLRADRIGWVVIGGESGPAARPCHVEWIQDVVDQCRATGVACFVKQLGQNPVAGRTSADPFRLLLADERRRPGWSRRWSDPADWPPELRVREFPAVTTDTVEVSA